MSNDQDCCSNNSVSVFNRGRLQRRQRLYTIIISFFFFFLTHLVIYIIICTPLQYSCRYCLNIKQYCTESLQRVVGLTKRIFTEFSIPTQIHNVMPLKIFDAPIRYDRWTIPTYPYLLKSSTTPRNCTYYDTAFSS